MTDGYDGEQNSEIRAPNSKQSPITKGQNSKQYDLEARTFGFAMKVRQFVRKLPRTINTLEDAKQLVRSSGSIGANYIEANEALSRKDFLMRLKISRKEAKETKYWLGLLQFNAEPDLLRIERQYLLQEVTELKNILSAIIIKCV
jgi:four helix bundle protein